MHWEHWVIIGLGLITLIELVVIMCRNDDLQESKYQRDSDRLHARIDLREEKGAREKAQKRADDADRLERMMKEERNFWMRKAGELGYPVAVPDPLDPEDDD